MRGAGKEGRKGRGGEGRYHVYVRGALKWLSSGRAGGPPLLFSPLFTCHKRIDMV